MLDKPLDFENSPLHLPNLGAIIEISCCHELTNKRLAL